MYYCGREQLAKTIVANVLSTLRSISSVKTAVLDRLRRLTEDLRDTTGGGMEEGGRGGAKVVNFERPQQDKTQ
jgi:hypothetical protein